MSSTLQIAISQKTGNVPVTVLHLTGELDANTQTQLETAANEVIDGGAEHLLLEMSKTSYIGSAGLRAIHAITNKLNKEENENAIKSDNLKVVNPSDEVRKIFHTLGFDTYIEIIDDLDTAVSSF